VVQPIYRDENGQITQETLAAFPNARKVKYKALPPLANEGAHKLEEIWANATWFLKLAVPAAEKAGVRLALHPNAKKVKFKDLPPLANEGAHNLPEMWANATWFLKLAVPAAEKAGVRLALHPNDPPAPVSRGSQQIMGSLAGWKRLIEIVNSPANGITYDSGVTREMGEDSVAVAEFFASRKRINHVHFRNVLVVKPYGKYQELFIDLGMADMFGVMKALVKNKYTGTIYPEHPRALDADRDRVGPGGRVGGYPGGGGYTGITYSVAYTRAMMQAALESV